MTHVPQEGQRIEPCDTGRGLPNRRSRNGRPPIRWPPKVARMKVDFYYPPSPPEGAAAAAIEAAETGYDGFFTAETQYDPFFPITHAAAAAPDLDYGTAIAVAFPRSPTVMAMTAWDLARQTQGKFMLGLGTQVRGHIVRRFASFWAGRPAPQLREYIEAMRAVWDSWQNGTPLSYEGEFYKLSLMTPFFNPGPIRHPDVPVYIAGVGPYLSALAGEICDGFHVHPFHTVPYLDEIVLPNMTKAAAAAGRSLDDVERVTTIFVMTGTTEEQIAASMEPVRQQISFYASTPSYRSVLEASGWDFGEKLHAMSKRGQWDQMPAAVPDEALDGVGVIAPIGGLATAIKERYGDRVQRVGFYTLGSVLMEDQDALRQVIAELQA
jgi:probable F420-dependent oxidoreductase